MPSRLRPLGLVLALLAAGFVAFGNPSPAEASGSSFSWPTSGSISGSVAWHESTEAQKAVDIAASSGTAVKAAYAGEVVTASSGGNTQCYSENHASNGYGNYIVLKHASASGTLYTLYAHLSSLSVAASATVTEGQQIGAVGQTGCADGAHLHFSIGTCASVSLGCTLWTGTDPSGSVTAGAAVPGTYTQLGQIASDGTPAAVARTSNNMDVFFRNSSNNLVARYWDSTNGWNATALVADGTVVGDPAAVTRTSGSMDVFYRNSGNNLVALSWNSSTGWNASTLITNGTVAGNPTVVARSANNMDVFFRSSSGSLVDVFWDSTNGWSLASWALNVQGDPAAISRSSSTINVFFRNTSNNLVAHYWDASAGWNNGVLIGDGTVAGDPAAVARTANNMEVFYRNSNNNLVDAYWSSVTGWASAAWADALAGDPAVVARTSGNLDVFFRNSSNQLVDRYWLEHGSLEPEYGW